MVGNWDFISRIHLYRSHCCVITLLLYNRRALGSLVIDLILLDLQKTDLRQPLLRNLKIVR